MGRHAADTRTTTRANRGLSPCRGPSARTCKEMPGTSCELNAGPKKIGTIMNLSSGADTHKSESVIPRRRRGHQSPAQSLNAIAQRQLDHASWAAEATRIGTDWRSLMAAVLEAGLGRLRSTISFAPGVSGGGGLDLRTGKGRETGDDHCTRRHQRRP
jgi:hypothetical protein